jgi:hypothetical protein
LIKEEKLDEDEFLLDGEDEVEEELKQIDEKI